MSIQGRDTSSVDCTYSERYMSAVAASSSMETILKRVSWLKQWRSGIERERRVKGGPPATCWGESFGLHRCGSSTPFYLISVCSRHDLVSAPLNGQQWVATYSHAAMRVSVCCFASRHGSPFAVQQTCTYCIKAFYYQLSHPQTALHRKQFCAAKQTTFRQPSCVSPSSTTTPNTRTSLSGSVTEVTSAFTRSSSAPRTQLSVACAR